MKTLNTILIKFETHRFWIIMALMLLVGVGFFVARAFNDTVGWVIINFAYLVGFMAILLSVLSRTWKDYKVRKARLIPIVFHKTELLSTVRQKFRNEQRAQMDDNNGWLTRQLLTIQWHSEKKGLTKGFIIAFALFYAVCGIVYYFAG